VTTVGSPFALAVAMVWPSRPCDQPPLWRPLFVGALTSVGAELLGTFLESSHRASTATIERQSSERQRQRPRLPVRALHPGSRRIHRDRRSVGATGRYPCSPGTCLFGRRVVRGVGRGKSAVPGRSLVHRRVGVVAARCWLGTDGSGQRGRLRHRDHSRRRRCGSRRNGGRAALSTWSAAGSAAGRSGRNSLRFDGGSGQGAVVAVPSGSFHPAVITASVCIAMLGLGGYLLLQSAYRSGHFAGSLATSTVLHPWVAFLARHLLLREQLPTDPTRLVVVGVAAALVIVGAAALVRSPAASALAPAPIGQSS